MNTHILWEKIGRNYERICAGSYEECEERAKEYEGSNIEICPNEVIDSWDSVDGQWHNEVYADNTMIQTPIVKVN